MSDKDGEQNAGSSACKPAPYTMPVATSAPIDVTFFAARDVQERNSAFGKQGRRTDKRAAAHQKTARDLAVIAGATRRPSCPATRTARLILQYWLTKSSAMIYRTAVDEYYFRLLNWRIASETAAQIRLPKSMPDQQPT